MLKYTILFTIAMGVPAFAATGSKIELSAKDGVKAVSASFLDQSEYEGVSSGGKHCKIEAVSLEGVFGGIEVTIINHLGERTTFSISSSDTKVFETETKFPSYQVVKWEAVKDGGGSVLEMTLPEDVNDFNMTIVEVIPNRVASCFVRE